MLKLEQQLQAEVEELIALAEQADQSELLEGMHLEIEIPLRKGRLSNLAEAKTILKARAKERDILEKAVYA